MKVPAFSVLVGAPIPARRQPATFLLCSHLGVGESKLTPVSPPRTAVSLYCSPTCRTSLNLRDLPGASGFNRRTRRRHKHSVQKSMVLFLLKMSMCVNVIYIYPWEDRQQNTHKTLQIFLPLFISTVQFVYRMYTLAVY